MKLKDALHRTIGTTPLKKFATIEIIGGAAYGVLVDPIGGIALILGGIGTRYWDELESWLWKKKEGTLEVDVAEIWERIRVAQERTCMGAPQEDDLLWLKLAEALGR